MSKCVCCDEPTYGRSAWCAIHSIIAGSEHAPPEDEVDPIELQRTRDRVYLAERNNRETWE